MAHLAQVLAFDRFGRPEMERVDEVCLGCLKALLDGNGSILSEVCQVTGRAK